MTAMPRKTRTRTPGNPTVQYLLQAARTEDKIISLNERGARYRDLACRTTGRTDALRAGGMRFDGSRLEDGLVRLMDLSQEKQRQAQALVDIVGDIEAVIARIEDDRYRDLLTWRYLGGWTWERITAAMDREDISWTHRLHSKALGEVERIRGEGMER